jgi:hypothetical protein
MNLKLKALAANVFEKAAKDTALAEKVLLERIEGDAALRAELLRPLVQEAIRSVVQESLRADRTVVSRHALRPSPVPKLTTRPDGRVVQPPKAQRAQAEAMARSVAETFFSEFTLANGVRLRTATYDQVAAQEFRYRSQGETMVRRAAFLKDILDKMSPNQTVEMVVDATTVLEMFREHGAPGAIAA